jgi:hypothetical protein
MIFGFPYTSLRSISEVFSCRSAENLERFDSRINHTPMQLRYHDSFRAFVTAKYHYAEAHNDSMLFAIVRYTGKPTLWLQAQGPSSECN